MRIVQVIESFGPGGAERMMLSLAAELRARGHDVVIAVPRAGWVSTKADRLGLNWSEYAPRGGAFDVPLLRRLRRDWSRERPDVIHCHIEGMATYVALASLGLGCRRILTVHGPGHMTQPRSSRERIHRWVAGTFFDVIACVSPSLERRVQQAGSLRARTTVIVNWLFDGERFRSGLEQIPRPADGRVRVVAVGNYRPEKDYETLVQGVAQAVIDGADLELCIAGGHVDSPTHCQLGDLVAECGLQDRVFLMPYVDDLGALLQSAAIFASSSVFEGFSLSILEAMRAGLPVVATRSGGADDLVVEGGSGFLVPVKDPGALADALSLLARQPQLRQDFGDFGRRRAQNWPTLADQATRYEAYYERNQEG